MSLEYLLGFTGWSPDLQGTAVGGMIRRFAERTGINEKGVNEKDGAVENVEGEGCPTQGLWLTLPDELMVSIVNKLSFSAFCSFRAVCKTWNALAVDPNARTLMVPRQSHDSIFCVIDTGFNRFSSYRPSSKSWHSLIACSGSPSLVLGFNCEENRVLAGSGGLLLLESLHEGLLVVNPINKSQLRLPLLSAVESVDEHMPSHRDTKKDVYFRASEENSSFMVLRVCDIFRYEFEGGHGAKREVAVEVQLYESQRNSWVTFYSGDYVSLNRIVSAVEFLGDIYCLVSFGPEDEDDDRPMFVMRLRDEIPYDTTWDADEPPSTVRGGELFVRDGVLLLAGVSGVRSWNETFQRVAVWKLSLKSTNWQPLVFMWPSIVSKKLPFGWLPHVVVHGEYIWVPNFNLWYTGSGVMCHLPSQSWWKVPENPETGRCSARVCNSCGGRDDLGQCLPFFFRPRMDLVL